MIYKDSENVLNIRFGMGQLSYRAGTFVIPESEKLIGGVEIRIRQYPDKTPKGPNWGTPFEFSGDKPAVKILFNSEAGIDFFIDALLEAKQFLKAIG